ncbi:hypothetical protein LTR56_000397 [Elasticomyces elasticus]|nr:hypothetical protein LTR56_000397 [Elasticomyces elasticus]KAK3666908.1 hypothetical protein LTR22_002133 [Elasticomyces elasticus]KAK4933390.1 hypothetical protein LTR49_000384 [Elasticomyces elasticus]KAK5755518.1 hypothetical protein LTS12_014386 [Elasticomyces elasticus]
MADHGSSPHGEGGARGESDEWLFADLHMDGVTRWTVQTSKSSKDIENIPATFSLALRYDEQDEEGTNSFGFDAIRLFGSEAAGIDGVADTFPGLSTFCVHLDFALDNLDDLPKAPTEGFLDTSDVRRVLVEKLQDAVDLLEWSRSVDLYFVVVTDVRHSQVKPEKEVYDGNKIKKADLAALLLANLGVPVFIGTLAAVGSTVGGSSVFID